MVKCWDVKRATEDALFRDVVRLDAGIMAGAFSPDYSQLMIGDSAGGLHLLKVDLPCDVDDDDRPGSFHFEPSATDLRLTLNSYEEHVREARSLLESGEMRITHDKGTAQAVQGPRYRGPVAQGEEAAASRLELEREERRWQKYRRRHDPRTYGTADNDIDELAGTPSPLLIASDAGDDTDDGFFDDDSPRRNRRFDLGIFRNADARTGPD